MRFRLWGWGCSREFRGTMLTGMTGGEITPGQRSCGGCAVPLQPGGTSYLRAVLIGHYQLAGVYTRAGLSSLPCTCCAVPCGAHVPWASRTASAP
jgi:hypothetical protein